MNAIIPPLAFILFLVIAFLLGLGGVKLAPKEPSSQESQTSYAGGEDIPGAKRFPGYRLFFPIALFFTILHVLALLLGMLPVGASVLGIAYAGVICFALLLLVLR